ncbi:iron-sulfur cluster assembly accessory protein [Synechococcales cyanobacterium C]|uniref:Iron-sulfur cluster assembly accessory protein n=1 Tax=Petrachloros mirabilis ULC683 TaxID=2781853 RepID=A0A8K2A6S9_9CYAN|nr:iron-sulfur cluster assembly accessory protein [Petrachloros mirabilis]NCJ05390.1 iron-sulfur cluster assembly accessory protein [Petrachloros mirabilis ULC683]
MIQLSPAAIGEVKRLRIKHLGAASGVLRITVSASGCAGLLYTLKFEPIAQPQDRVFICEDLQVAVDAQSFPTIDGLLLDYSEDLMGGGFRFHNPNAVQTCGCGNSFAVSAV